MELLRVKRCVLTAVIVLVLGLRGESYSKQVAELTEELIFQPIETVITAGRTEQNIERAPATVTVISAEEIKASGALNIPELLSLVPGLDVATVNSSHFEVNARGLNQLLSNKMLVLIDGRSAYFDFFGGVIWPALQIVMEQIDRIEIVRSPSSALYGANAFSGVINIITKNPRQIGGSHLNLRTGEQSTLYTSFMYGGRKGDTGFRLVLGSRQMDSFGKPSRDFEKNVLGNLLVEHRFSDDSRLSAEGGLIHGSVYQLVRLENNKFDATTSYAKMNYEKGTFTLQTFWNRGDETGEAFFPGTKPVDILYNTFDVEAQNTFNIGQQHTFIGGATYRFNTIESNIIDQSHHQNLIAVYFQDEYRPVPEVSLLAGARIDHHPLVGVNFSPRGSVIYSPTGRHTFRASVGRAFRNPSFTDSYFKLSVPPPPPYPPEYGFTLKGASDLEAEKITTYELGYTFFPRHYFRSEIDLFAYSFKDYIEPGKLNTSVLPAVQSFVNLGSAKAWGLEVTVDVLPAPWIKLSSNYSFQSLTNHYSVLGKQQPPTQKVNFKTYLSLPCRVTTSFSVGYVGKTTWEVPNPTGSYNSIETESRARCDAKISYNALDGHADIYLAAYNLFDSRYREYPAGEDIRGRVTAGFQVNF
ncbi:MAG: TonB-dependent receptor [Candidatus Glassbacteria bacterium]